MNQFAQFRVRSLSPCKKVCDTLCSFGTPDGFDQITLTRCDQLAYLFVIRIRIRLVRLFGTIPILDKLFDELNVVQLFHQVGIRIMSDVVKQRGQAKFFLLPMRQLNTILLCHLDDADHHSQNA